MIALAKMWNIPVSERKIGISEVMDANGSGKLDEIFGSGTAAVISPVGEIKYGDQVITVGGGEVGPMANRFYQELTDIQYGRTKDPAGWIESI